MDDFKLLAYRNVELDHQLTIIILERVKIVNLLVNVLHFTLEHPKNISERCSYDS